MLRFTCPHCRTVLQVADHQAGSSVACGKCRQVVQLPAPVMPAASPVQRRIPAAIVPTLPPPSVKASLPPLKAPRRALATVGLWSIPVLVVLLLVGATYLLAHRLGKKSSTAPSPLASELAGATPEEAPEPDEPASSNKSPAVEKKPAPDPSLSILAAKAVDAINAERRAAGVPAVTLDAAVAAGCQAHAHYLLHNAAVLSERGANPHEEDPALPGAGSAGAQAAVAAHIDLRPPLTTVAGWLKAPGHRALLLSPRLRGIGVGIAHEADRWMSVFSLPRTDPEEPAGAIFYPADGQTEVPLAFTGTETPDPLPDTEDKTAGFPLTITFAPQKKVAEVQAQLEDEAGQAVSVRLSSPEHPANPKYPTVQQNSVCLLAREPLRPGTRYLVHLTARVQGRAWQATWSFTTIAPGATRRDLTAEVLKRINARREGAGLKPAKLDRRRSAACTAHASYLLRNFTHLADQGVLTEQENLPGYTEEGKRTSRRAWVAMDGGPDDVIRVLLSSIYFRYKVLNPGLRSVAIGRAPSLFPGHIWVVDLSDVGGVRPDSSAILYPADGEKEVPGAYLAEEDPRPIPDPDRVGGVAVTAFLVTKLQVRAATAQLTDEAGQEVASWLLAAEKPLIPGLAETLVGLVPKDPLKPGVTYRVHLKARLGGKLWTRSWSFTTSSKPFEPTQDELAAVALNKANAVRKWAGLKPLTLDAELTSGCLAHARYLVRNGSDPAVQGLGVHKEDSRLPGATPAGARAARGIIGMVPNPTSAVEGWVATPFHRFPLLAPDLKRIGFAAVRDLRTRSWEVVLDTANGR